METARFRLFALVLCTCLVGLSAMTRIAQAQCVPDTPPEAVSQVPNCENGDHGGAGGGMLIARVPARVFFQNPVGATVSWMVARSRPAGVQGMAVATRRQPVVTLRSGRTPRQVAR